MCARALTHIYDMVSDCCVLHCCLSYSTCRNCYITCNIFSTKIDFVHIHIKFKASIPSHKVISIVEMCKPRNKFVLESEKISQNYEQGNYKIQKFYQLLQYLGIVFTDAYDRLSDQFSIIVRQRGDS